MNVNNHFSKKAANISTEVLQEEIDRRKERPFRFPLEVFPQQLQPMIDQMIDKDKLDLIPEFVGLALLRCYSVAIGTGYAVKTSFPKPLCLAIWGTFVGISSSGKSAVQGIVDMPLHKMQDEFDRDFQLECEGRSNDEIMRLSKKTVVLRESRMATILSSVLPQNPKGILKDSDEILEFINGMNAGNKNGVGNEEEIWMAAWNGQKYNKQLAGNKYYNIPKMFASVAGGIQPGILWKMWQKDRGVTGFVFRFLFALPQIDKKTNKNILFEMDETTLINHEKCCQFLYKQLEVDGENPSKLLILNYDAKVKLNTWMKERTFQMNQVEDITERNKLGGIQGKMDEYVYRIAGILAVMHYGFEQMNNQTFTGFPNELHINLEIMNKAIAVTDYFEEAAKRCCEIVDKNLVASDEAIMVANMTKANYELWKIGERIFETKALTAQDKKNLAERTRKLRDKLKKEYPGVFGAKV